MVVVSIQSAWPGTGMRYPALACSPLFAIHYLAMAARHRRNVERRKPRSRHESERRAGSFIDAN